MPVDPLQFLSLLAFLRMSNGSSYGLSSTSAAASNMNFFDHRGFMQDPSTPESDYPSDFETIPSTASFPLLHQLLLIFSGQFASISQDISSLRRSIASLESSLSAVEDRIIALTDVHESNLTQPKDEPFQTHTKALSDAEELGQQLRRLSGTITAQQDRMNTLHDMVGALQACTVHIDTDHQLLAEHARSYKEFDASQKCLRDQLATQIQHHVESKKDFASLRLDLQNLSDLASINDTKTNVSLDNIRSQIVDQVKDQNRTEKEVALLREQMTKKFGAFQLRVSSLTLDAVKKPHGVQLTDQTAKEARRAKAMAGLGLRIMQLQGNSRCILANEDIASQNDDNAGAVSSACSSLVVSSSAASLRPSVRSFQDSDVFKASSSCVQWVGTTAPSDSKVPSNLHSPPPCREYANFKENVDGINSPSTSAAFRQDDAEAGVLRRKQKEPAPPLQPKDVNRMPMPSPPSLDVMSTATVLPRPGLSTIQRGDVFAPRTFNDAADDSGYRNKSLYASPLSGVRTQGWL
ncbi:hypothetical protein DFH29DRAFT_995544 [Suillus ampliporus]|nr:hypothetical protein DFH29DRAFT_995544 [Suillus ampliporus]